jgi:hypothetical protein
VHELIVKYQSTWLKDGHSVSLKIQKQELAKFKSDQGEGFGKVQ